MKKSYIIIIIAMVLYMVLVIMLFGEKREEDRYIIIGNDTVWQLKDNKWNNISNKNSLINNNLYIYDGSSFIGKRELNYANNRWYIFDKNQNSVRLENELFASDKNIEVKNFDVDTLNVEDVNNINKFGKRSFLSVSDLNNTNINQKISLDFDNDKKNEILYFISNMFIQGDSNKFFSYVLYYDNNKLYELENNVENENRLDSYIYSISNIIDYNNDNKFEIIINQYPFRPTMDCKKMYKLEHGQYKMIKDCE